MAGTAVGNLTGLFGLVFIIALIVGTVKLIQVSRKGGYELADSIKSGRKANVNKDYANYTKKYKLVGKIFLFVLAVGLIIGGIFKLRAAPQDETSDEEQQRSLQGFALLGGGFLFLIGAFVNLALG